MSLLSDRLLSGRLKKRVVKTDVSVLGNIFPNAGNILENFDHFKLINELVGLIYDNDPNDPNDSSLNDSSLNDNKELKNEISELKKIIVHQNEVPNNFISQKIPPNVSNTHSNVSGRDLII